jgi:exodeoxyribonuclease VII large subunit
MSSAVREDIAAQAARVDNARARMARCAPNPGAIARDLAHLLRDLQNGLERRCAVDRARLEHATARMTGLDPHATLARGFAIVQKSGTGKVVTSVKKVKSGERLDIAVADGAFWAEVS